MSDRIGQRQANRMALEMGAALVETSDLEQLFADAGDGSHEQDEIFTNAQNYAVRRILALIRNYRTC